MYEPNQPVSERTAEAALRERLALLEEENRNLVRALIGAGWQLDAIEAARKGTAKPGGFLFTTA